MNRRLIFTLSGVLIALASLAAGCSSGTEADPTPVKTFKITPASGTRTPATAAPAATKPAAAASPSAGASPSAAAASPTSGAGAETKLELVESNIAFDKTELTASPGAVTIHVNNKDGGIPHNLHVFKGSSASGESVGTTAIEAGPGEQDLKLTLAAGDYFFQCDVHPPTMSGKLTVK
jgi:plastocyanin